jgi:hypothetical protein
MGSCSAQDRRLPQASPASAGSAPAGPRVGTAGRRRRAYAESVAGASSPGVDGFSPGRSFTTAHVTDAASAMTQTIQTTTPMSPRIVSTSSVE